VYKHAYFSDVFEGFHTLQGHYLFFLMLLIWTINRPSLRCIEHMYYKFFRDESLDIECKEEEVPDREHSRLQTAVYSYGSWGIKRHRAG
jgi:hypothetical protein